MRGKRLSFGSSNHVSVARSPLVAGGSSCHRDPWLAVTCIESRSVGVRAMEPNDAALLVETYRHLSLPSRRQRFLSTISDYTARWLDVVGNEVEGHYTLIAALVDDPGGPIVATAQFVHPVDDPIVAEPAIAVTDDYQGHGLGTLLWEVLVDAAREQGVRQFVGILQDSNAAMRRILTRAGARMCADSPGLLRAEVAL
jgi:GNAT superfamily N-acetyltransferase